MGDLPRLGCPYPRCPSHYEPDQRMKVGAEVAQPASKVETAADAMAKLHAPGGRIRACTSCGRLMVACLTKNCQSIGTYNRPFVRFCRRCGESIDPTNLWDKVGQDGWNLVPRSFDPPEVVADLSALVEPTATRYLIALAMIRGALAVHHAGQYLALLKTDPSGNGAPFLWEWTNPFPLCPDRSFAPPHTPRLLPGERYLMFSCPQGLLILDLWSCHGLSAKDNAPRYRLLRIERRSLVVPPIPLDEHRIGLVTRGRSRAADNPYRWAVWDRSLAIEEDARLSALLETEDSDPLKIVGRNCRSEVIDDRVITFSTVREQWVWRRSDALTSDIDKMERTWPSQSTHRGDSIVLDEHDEFQSATSQTNQAFLVQRLVGGRQLRGFERFSWFYCVRRDNASILEALERYEVEFESLRAQTPQPIHLPSGAQPIGAAPDLNEIPQMYFRVGTEIWFQNDGPSASLYQGGLPQTIVSHHLTGPLVLSVGEKDHGSRYIQLDSLHHRGVHATIPIENQLVSDPLLWYRWLFTVELDQDRRLLLLRRIVRFDEPAVRR